MPDPGPPGKFSPKAAAKRPITSRPGRLTRSERREIGTADEDARRNTRLGLAARRCEGPVGYGAVSEVVRDECARAHIRFSFACSDETILKGIARVRSWVQSLR